MKKQRRDEARCERRRETSILLIWKIENPKIPKKEFIYMRCKKERDALYKTEKQKRESPTDLKPQKQKRLGFLKF